MCIHLNLKILIHIFTIIYLIMVVIIMRGENFVAHLDGLGGTPVCRGTPVAHHWSGGWITGPLAAAVPQRHSVTPSRRYNKSVKCVQAPYNDRMWRKQSVMKLVNPRVSVDDVRKEKSYRISNRLLIPAVSFLIYWIISHIKVTKESYTYTKL
jgi:hypothetical protein